MIKVAISILLVASLSFAQTTASFDKVRKEIDQVQTEVNSLISAGVPGIWMLHSPKAAFLDEYGLVVTMLIALERPRNPFSGPPADNLQSVMAERRKQIQEKLVDFLKLRAPQLESIGPSETMSVIVHFMNTNPADVPNAPSQLVLTVKKQDAGAVRIQVREF